MRESLNKTVYEKRNILPSFPQRRNPDVDHVQTVEQIIPEFPFTNGMVQVHVGRSNDAHIHFKLFRSTDAVEFPFLQHAQQIHLQLVEMSPISSRKSVPRSPARTCLSAAMCPGERSLLMAKELGFKKRSGSAAHETPINGFVCAVTGEVDGPRNQFLARATLTLDQHSAPQSRNVVYEIENLSIFGLLLRMSWKLYSL